MGKQGKNRSSQHGINFFETVRHIFFNSYCCGNPGLGTGLLVLAE
jgi:hypothetical protein